MRALTKPTLIALSFGLLAAVPNDANAQSQNCGPHAVVTEHLLDRFGEQRVSIAMASDSSVMEVFVNEDSGSWTVTITRAGQPTCLVAAGQNWQFLVPEPPGEDM